MKKIFLTMTMCASVAAMAACAQQNTPSMMNTSRIALEEGAQIKQIPVSDIRDGHLRLLAEEYARYGTNALHLSLAYNPASRDYTSLHAFQDLAKYKKTLAQYGVRNVTAETVKVSDAAPSLMVSYESARARAPEGCELAPGVSDNRTTRNLGGYKFGCSIDTMVAQQIYRPDDLRGNASLDSADGRRAANTVEHYRVFTEAEANRDLDLLGRDQIQAR